jgi:type IX secretion system substrate protein
LKTFNDGGNTLFKMILGENVTEKIEVFFNPKSVGDHQLVLRFNVEGVDTDDQPTATLSGTGTVPYASTTPVDFGWTFRNEVANIQTEVTLLDINASAEAGQDNQWDATKQNSFFADDLTIETVIIKDGSGKILTTVAGTDFGTEGFRFDLDGLDLPTDPPLAPDAGTFSIQSGEFVAPDRDYPGNIDNFTGTIVFVTDAWEENIECVWTGEGHDQKYSTTIDPFETCASVEVIANVSFLNNGPDEITITGIEINPIWTVDDPDANVLLFQETGDHNIIDPKVVADGNTAAQTLDVPMVFMPNMEMVYTAEIIFTATINGVEETIVQAFSAQVGQVEGNLNVVLSDKNPLVNAPNGVKVNCGFDVVKAGGASNVERLEFTVTYDQDILMIRKDGNGNPAIELHGPISGYTVYSAEVVLAPIDDPMPRMGKIIYTIDGNGFDGNNADNLFSCTFDTFLPPYGHEDVPSIISVDNRSFQSDGSGGFEEEGCLTLNSASDDFELQATCVYDLRKLGRPGSNGSIMLENPVPNPASQMTTINFTLVESGQTSLVLNRSDGALVEVFFNEYKEKGVYQVTIDASKLTSGVYGYTLKNGNYQTSKLMNVVK